MDMKKRIEELRVGGRVVARAKFADEDLGPLSLLPGRWSNLPGLPGHGWNMIALPFATAPGSLLNYRLLLNQYNEELVFSIVDKAVPNRGISGSGAGATNTDQLLVALQYEQSVTQIAADDSPHSGLAGGPGLAIHREPGLWLRMLNEITDGVSIARLATVPHGDAVLALGDSAQVEGPPSIPALSGLPIGGPTDLNAPYLAPYKHFHDNPFQGLFDPVVPAQLLQAANAGTPILRTTALTVDTEVATGGIHNTPFVVKQAEATAMESTFWIEELGELDASGRNKLRLQYLQVVLLDFVERQDGVPGRIRWPHVSINTLERVGDLLGP
jgi:hypothetical protein